MSPENFLSPRRLLPLPNPLGQPQGNTFLEQSKPGFYERLTLSRKKSLISSHVNLWF